VALLAQQDLLVRKEHRVQQDLKVLVDLREYEGQVV
jgi:hypothetical protein